MPSSGVRVVEGGVNMSVRFQRNAFDSMMVFVRGYVVASDTLALIFRYPHDVNVFSLAPFSGLSPQK